MHDLEECEKHRLISLYPVIDTEVKFEMLRDTAVWIDLSCETQMHVTSAHIAYGSCFKMEQLLEF